MKHDAEFLTDEEITTMASSIIKRHPRNPSKYIIGTAEDMFKDGYTDEFVTDLVRRIDAEIKRLTGRKA